MINVNHLFNFIVFFLLPLLNISLVRSENSNIVEIKNYKFSTTITIKGNVKPLKVMHITDSHITIPDQRDSIIWNNCQRMHQAFKNTKKHLSKSNVSREQAFINLLDTATEQKIDLILLTGDIVNFPSPKSIDFVYNTLKSYKIPFLYVAGNHDWHLEGEVGSSDYLRKKNLHFLSPLYESKKPLYNSTVINGINFVCIDNSTYQINKKQLKFFKKQLKKDYPIVLLMHIPVYTSENSYANFTMGNPNWGEQLDSSYKVERREKWSKKGNNKHTIEFHNLLISKSNIIILTGHIHKQCFERKDNFIQFITGLSRDGYYRILEFNKK